MRYLKLVLIGVFLFCQNVFCQTTKSIEVNKIRFKTQKLQDLLSNDIRDFKKEYKKEPKIIIITFSENEKKILMNVEIAVNYFMSDDQIQLLGKFNGGLNFKNVNILLRNYDNLKFKNKPFFFVDSEKISFDAEIGGDVTSREWKYFFENGEFKFLETISIEDILED